jgi:hypothetical protein
MVNTKQKGQRKELLCAKELQKDGYFIAFRSFTVKRGPCFVGVDFADTFDVVALRPQQDINGHISKLAEWRFISCSFASHRAEKIAAVKRFKELYGLLENDYEVWVWTPARWRGRGDKKHFEQARWEKIVV